MSTSKGGPRTRAQKREEHRRAVQDDLEQIALDAAPHALRTLMRAFMPLEPTEFPPTREQIQAATYVLNQVIGRPSAKTEPIDASSKVDDILNQILALRRREALGEALGTDLGAEPRGVPGLVEAGGP